VAQAGADTNAVWRLDAAVQRTVREGSVQQAPGVAAASRAMNWWGGPGVIWFGAVVWLGARAAGRRALSQAGLRGIEALTIASAVSAGIKGLAGRARPFVVPGEPWHWEFNHGWSDARYFSMPSGHTTATAAFVLAFVMATRSWATALRLSLGIPLLLTALLVPASRVISDQHWLSDVLVGLLIGAATAVVVARVHRDRVPSRYDRVLLGRATGEGTP
jgi:membrane-associated phospholipid phosphatase